MTDTISSQTRNLFDLGQEFERIQGAIDALTALERAMLDAGPVKSELLMTLHELADQKHARLYEICYQSVSLRATTIPELAIKSRMLQEYCVDRDRDIVHELAKSLCIDVQRCHGQRSRTRKRKTRMARHFPSNTTGGASLVPLSEPIIVRSQGSFPQSQSSC